MPRKIIRVILAIGFLVCVLPAFAHAKERRVALIIGNGLYPYPNALKNPAADAYDLEQALKRLGFEVFTGINVGKQSTEKLIEAFGKRLKKTRGVGLFYYSGIGYQVKGENYLVPVGASFAGEKETINSSIPLGSVLAKIAAAKNKTNIVLLDAANKTTTQQIWLKPASLTARTGFSKISAPTGTIIFYSSENGRNSAESCGRNGVFAASLLRQLENPLLEFGQLTEKVAAEVSLGTSGWQKPFAEGNLSKPFYFADKKRRLKPKQPATPEYLEALFECFKLARKKSCGQLGEAVMVGREIVEKYGNDPDNQELINYVKKETERIEKQDPICRGNTAYDAAYKAKDWAKFMKISKEIIAREGQAPLALDVMLTLVSVGYDQAVMMKNDTFNADTINYAKQAIQRLENGTTTITGNWGVFVPFKNRIFPDGKTNALNGLNYILGWINYNRLGINDLGKKKEGLVYLYKSTQYNGEFKSDYTIYTTIGNYYDNEATVLDEAYRKIRAANNNAENGEAKLKLALARGYAERSIDAFGRALKVATTHRASPKVIEALKKAITDRYRLRFNIAPGIQPEGVETYLEKLISKPMPSPETMVEPVWQ